MKPSIPTNTKKREHAVGRVKLRVERSCLSYGGAFLTTEGTENTEEHDKENGVPDASEQCDRNVR